MKLFRRLRGASKANGRDTIVFLLSLLLAFSIWLIHNLSRDYSGVVSVPVVAESSIEGHSRFSSDAVTAVARCRTSGFNLLRSRFYAERREVRVKIDRADLHSAGGENFFLAGPAKNSYVQQIFGDGTALEAFISDTLMFRFPVENHKKVPVEIVNLLTFRPQYMAAAPIRIDPDSVTVYGEPLHLDNIDRVYTQPLTGGNIHGNIHGMLKLSRISGIRLSEEEVRYSMQVTRFVELRSTVQIKVSGAPAGKHLQVYPSSAEVVYHCVFPLTSDPSESVDFFVDYNDFAQSVTGRCIPRPGRLPQGVIDYVITPEVFDCLEVD